jgi:hypothetical protein
VFVTSDGILWFAAQYPAMSMCSYHLFLAFGEGRDLFGSVPEHRYRGRGVIDRSLSSELEDGSGCIDGILV